MAYAVASLVPVIVLGLVLYGGYRRDGVARARAQGRAQAAVIEEMAIAPVVGRRDLTAGLRPAERDGLLDATQLAIFSGSVVRLRVRSFAGRVVFSASGVSLADQRRTRAYYQLASTAQYEPGLYGIAVAKGEPGLRGALQAALARVMASGEYGHVLRRWGVFDGAVHSASVNGGTT